MSLLIWQHGWDHHDLYSAPWDEAAVCRRWRELALSCSNFWAHIYISIPEIILHQQELKLLCKRVKLQFTRSLETPWEIHLYLQDVDKLDEADLRRFVATLRLLVSNFYRCRRLACAEIPPYGKAVRCLSKVQDLRQLERLQLFNCPAVFIQDTPVLERLQLGHIDLKTSRGHLWRNLRCLSLVRCRSTELEVLEVLRLSRKQLEYVLISSILPRNTGRRTENLPLPPQTDYPRKLSQASLVLDPKITRRVTDYAFLHILAPNLTTLSVPLYSHMDDELLRIIQQFIQASGCKTPSRSSS